jgi:DNA-binding transcriptional LysR family regulator
MEIRQLQYFKQVCADRSLSKAAENLFITQQGLSHSIGKLERELGVTLFLRTQYGVIPTEAALSFKDDVNELLDSFSLLKAKMQMTAREAKGRLRLGLTQGATTRFVPWLVGEFAERYPNIELMITEAPDGVIEEHILADACELACTHMPADTEQIEWFPLLQDEVVVMMRRDNPLSMRSCIRIADLKDEKFIMLPPEFKWHGEILELCAKSGYTPRIAYTTWDINITFNLIREVGGIGFLHRDLGQSFRTDDIALVPVHPEEGIHWELGIARKKGRKQGYACEILLDYIQEIAAEILHERENPENRENAASPRREKVGNVIVIKQV